ncbi:MAG: DUF3786 domain-containing protein, partial [Desulfobacteraceae bacterium]
MPEPKNAMAVFKLLDKSNCGKCGEKTCLAFAGAVFTGSRILSECPKMAPADPSDRFDGARAREDVERSREAHLEQLKRQIPAVDLNSAAERTGGRSENGRLTIKVLGKDFSITPAGRISTEIHVNPWVTVPFLNYVLFGKGLNPTGDWRSFRELTDGRERYPLFRKRCEEPMKQVADRYTDFFDDPVHM